jgi:hypothetical protein
MLFHGAHPHFKIAYVGSYNRKVALHPAQNFQDQIFCVVGHTEFSYCSVTSFICRQRRIP